MKRTCFVLASLLAITLLSCSSLDNSIEDVNYPQATALQKVLPSDDIGIQAMAAANSRTVSCPGTMSVSNISYGSYSRSSKVTCDFTSLPSNAKNTKYEFTTSIVVGAVGTFGVSSFRLECGANYTDIPWNGFPLTISTTDFVDDPANVKCYISFYGRCDGTGYSTGNIPVGCSYSRNNATMTNDYY